jgi:hypothetical protein
MLKKIIWSIIILIVILGIISSFFFFDWGRSSRHSAVDFADCVSSGFAVMESYPRQCRDGLNKLFVEDVGNTLAKADLIYMISPKPNEQVYSPIHISGRARGMWFFEASFPIKLKTTDGKVLGTAIAKASTDWMTNEFVDYTADLYFHVATTTLAIIELNKDNPSGRPDLQDLLIVPIVLLSATTTAKTDL